MTPCRGKTGMRAFDEQGRGPSSFGTGGFGQIDELGIREAPRFAVGQDIGAGRQQSSACNGVARHRKGGGAPNARSGLRGNVAEQGVATTWPARSRPDRAEAS